MSKTPTISDVLRRAIAESGIPLLRLEQETGVVRASMMRFVRGDQSLRLDKADALAAYLGLRLVADSDATPRQRTNARAKTQARRRKAK